MKKSIIVILFLIISFITPLFSQEKVFYSNVIKKLRVGDVASANEALEVLKFKYPQSRYVVDASLSIIERNTDYFDSLVRLRQLLASYPDYPEPDHILYKLSNLYYLHNNYTEALSGFLSIGTNYPKSKYRPGAYYWAGNIAFFRKEYPKAEYYFWETLKSKVYDTYQPMAALRLGDLTFEQKRYYSAISNYKRAIKNYVDSEVRLEACYYLAESYANVRNYSESEKYYNIVIKEFPESELAKMALLKVKNVIKKKKPALQKNVAKPKVSNGQVGKTAFYLNVGSYTDARSANNMRLALKKDGFPVVYKVESQKKKYVYIVRIGKFDKEDEAEKVFSQVKEKYKIEATLVEDIE